MKRVPTELTDTGRVIKEALMEIRRLKRQLDERRLTARESVAVIGMACRFPGGITGPESFWKALVEMRDMIGEVPAHRWQSRAASASADSPYLRKAGFLTEDIEAFDHRLFQFSPREAERTDPQQRLFLKVVWEALENSGYAPNTLKGSKTGIYAGISLPDYMHALHLDRQTSGTSEPDDVAGSGFSFLSGRAAYFFGFQGPGITVDTACSSSLVAVDQACKGLMAGDCDMAVAGGVNLMYSPQTTELLSALGILSSTCQMRSFDAGANGTVRGEGCGAVILKRLSAAVRDGDSIHAVIRGSGVNQDGLSSGLTAPYGPAQEALLADVWERCGLDSRDLGYIEAHGTATALGDPIELSALGNVVAKDRESRLYVGTVKANIGHLEAAAGIAGLIKAIMAVERGRIPGNPHFETPSPHIEWERLPLDVPKETIAWESGGKPRAAGVSSFGLSGTNAHVVVEQYCGERQDDREPGASDNGGKRWPFKFSSVTEDGLREQLAVFLEDLERQGRDAAPGLPDMAYSQNISKADLKIRLVVWAGSREELAAAINRALAGTPHASVSRGVRDKKVVFLFTGQGSQYPAMFAELYRDNPIFRAGMDRCSAVYREITGHDVMEIIASTGHDLNETRYTQPALFAVEYSLARMWMAYGVEPACMIGHSVGEYAAACIAGVFEPEDAMRLITARGELMHGLAERGKMAAVFAGRERVRRLLGSRTRVAVAAANTPGQTVVSGAAEEVDEVCRDLNGEGVRTVPLQVSHAFHSPLMAPMLAEFEAIARTVKYNAPKKAIISSATGRPIDGEMASPSYWTWQIQEEVKFLDCIRSLDDVADYVFLEIGPSPVLTSMVEDICDGRTDCAASHIPQRDAAEQIERSFVHLYGRGVPVKWRALYAHANHRKIAVPNYRFSERRFGLDGPQEHSRPVEENRSTVLAAASPGPLPLTPEERKAYIRQALIRELKLEEDELADERNLLLHGLNSIVAARLAAQWGNELGIRLNPGRLLGECTIAQWADMLGEQTEQSAGAEPETAAAFRMRPEQRGEPFPLNEVQLAYWAGRNAELEWGGVGCYAYFEIDAGGLDPVRFKQALVALVRRHEMLRAEISADGMQLIMPDIELPLAVYRQEEIADLPAHLGLVRDEMSAQVLPLGRPMFDLRLTEMGEDSWRVHFGIDFLIADALSLHIFWSDLNRLYKGEPLPELKASFKDYLQYVSERKQSSQVRRDRAYWLGKAEGFPSAPELPVNLSQATLGRRKFVRRQQWLSPEAWHAFARAAAERRLTPSAALLALYAEVLSAWGGGGRFAVMLTVFNREAVHPQIHEVIGDFTQLALVDIRREQTTAGRNADSVQRQMQADLAHVGYSAIDFVKELNNRDGAQGRMYPVVFTSALGMEQLGGGSSTAFMNNLGWSVSSTPQVWLDHQVYAERDGVTLSWDTLDAVFQPGVVDAMFAKYVELVERAATEPGFWSETLTDLRTDSQRRVHWRVNYTDNAYTGELLHGHIQRRAYTDADRIAIICADRSYSYGQLMARADQVTELLQEQGVKPGDKVAIRMDKSFSQIAAVLGVAQAGAAYVPLACDQPVGRMLDIVRRAGISILLADRAEPAIGTEIAQFTAADWEGKQGIRQAVDLDPAELAYVIYTSGSTGTPKGVCIAHGAAMNTIIDVNSRLGVTADDRILGVSAYNFDLSVYDIFGVLSAGGTLVLPSEEERTDPKCWRRLSMQHGVTLWNSVPALLDLYTDYLLECGESAVDGGIRHILLSGDWIPLGLFEKAEKALPNAALTGMGGATEASIWSNFYPIRGIDPDWTSIPYGYPLANQAYYILDEFGRPCPDGVKGQLHIAGKGLADGYLNEEALTSKVFYRHAELNERLYSTGDYGRYMKDGAIEFLGRMDNQLKINGYRIEVGEIQAAFAKCGVVGDVIVVPVGERMESKKLVVYIKDDGATLPEPELKQLLRGYLPGYSIPERMIAVPAFPMTANGKIDRKALVRSFIDIDGQNPSKAASDRAEQPSERSSEPPQELHSVVPEPPQELHPVLRTVREVLRMPKLKPADRLGDLGVSSVDMIRLANRLEAEYADRPSVGEMIGHESVQELLDYYGERAGKASEPQETPESLPQPIEPEERREDTKAEQLIERCRSLGIRLRAEDGRLTYKAAAGTMTPELQAELKSCKQQLLDYIRERGDEAEGAAWQPESRAFRLTPIQLAYVLGRAADYELGGTSAHYYAEFECRHIDASKLEQAVNEVVRTHDMLRTVIYENGTQEVLAHTPVFRVPVRQIGDRRELEAIRSEWSHHVYDLGEWPMFHVQISRLDDELSRLHFSFDCLIVDGWSAEMMFREIFKAYNGKSVYEPEFTFRDYIRQEAGWLERKNYHKASADYWERKLADTPPAPQLPFQTPLQNIAAPRFRRLKLVLTEAQTRILEERIRKHRFTPSAAVCTAYMKVLSHWSSRKDIALNLTLFNRLPLHPDVPHMLGDFTNIALISYEPEDGASFVQETERIQAQLWQAVENRTHDGIGLLRRLARDAPGKAVMPVVFTSLLFGESSAFEDDDFPPDMKEVFAISQTPQVVIDHQAYKRNGSMTLIWDYVEEAFRLEEIEEMFRAYTELIERLIADGDDWRREMAVSGEGYAGRREELKR